MLAVIQWATDLLTDIFVEYSSGSDLSNKANHYLKIYCEKVCYMNKNRFYKYTNVLMYINFIISIVHLLIAFQGNNVSLIDFVYLIACVMLTISMNIVSNANMQSIKIFMLPVIFTYMSLARLIIVLCPNKKLLAVILAIISVALVLIAFLLYIQIRRDIKEKKELK